MKRDVLGHVLCGGGSRRMGEDKAALRMRPGISQLDYTVDLLRPFCEDLSAGIGEAADRVLPSGVEGVIDDRRMQGPAGSLLSALRFARGRAVVLVACDMPYLEPAVFVQLLNRRNPDALATVFLASDAKPEPLCAIYEGRFLDLLLSEANEGRSGLRGMLLRNQSSLELVELDRPELLASVNDRPSLDRAIERLSR